MDDTINKLIRYLPILIAVFLGYLVYDFWWYKTDPSSPYSLALAEITQLDKDNIDIDKKIQAAIEFKKSLEQRRNSLRALALELQQMKATLSEQMDIPGFMKLVVIEAARVGLKVTGIKPTDSKTQEYYLEQAFNFSFKSVYPQLLVFLERLANLETIIRVDNFDIKRVGSATKSYVELEGTLQLKTFRYLGSKADEIARQEPTSAPSVPSVATPGAGVSPGAPAPSGMGPGMGPGTRAPPQVMGGSR